MKTFIFIISILCLSSCISYQDKSIKEDKNFQAQLNKEYKDSATSPLYPIDRENFQGHDFFPISSSYIVKAHQSLTDKTDTIAMVTSSGKTKKYIAYSQLHFTLNGKEQNLTSYVSLQLMNNPQYKDYLFLPFRDETNDITSYGGGRYMDLKISGKNEVILDFNRAYNPYCAYSEEYNCPIVPNSNFINTNVEAGVRLEGGHFDYHKN